ncbi:unnamed protein product [Caenorhabditis brenneri]
MRKQNRPNTTARKQMQNLTDELIARDKNARPSLDDAFLNSPTASSEQAAAISPTSEPIQELDQVLLAPEPMEPSHRKPRSSKKLVHPISKTFTKKPTEVKPMKSDEPKSVESTEESGNDQIDTIFVDALTNAWKEQKQQYNVYSLMKKRDITTEKTRGIIQRLKSEIEKEESERKEEFRGLPSDKAACICFHVRATPSKKMIEEYKGRMVLSSDRTISQLDGVHYNKVLHVGRPRKQESLIINGKDSLKGKEEEVEAIEKEVASPIEESPILESASSVVDSTPVPPLPVENSVPYVTTPPLQRVPYDAPPKQIVHADNQAVMHHMYAEINNLREENRALRLENAAMKMELGMMRNMENSWKKSAKLLISIRDRYVPAAIPSQPHHSHPSEPMSFAACVRKQPSIESMFPSPYAKFDEKTSPFNNQGGFGGFSRDPNKNTNPFANRKRYNENDSSPSNNSHFHSNRFYPERSSDQSRDTSENTGGFAAHNPRPNGFMTRSIPRESASSGMLPNRYEGRSFSTASSHYPFSQGSNSSGHYSSFSKPSHSTSLNIPSHGHVEDFDGFLTSNAEEEIFRGNGVMLNHIVQQSTCGNYEDADLFRKYRLLDNSNR